ncbi:hypothetical protein MTO96_042022 [Rhipicephalus appendiculatus]
MDPGKSTRKNINWRYPSTPISTTALADSQVKCLFHHFDPNRTATPAFVWQSGARITDARVLLDLVTSSTTTLILNVGTNDLTSSTGRVTFDNYRDLLHIIAKERSGISRVYASLVLPRATYRHYAIITSAVFARNSTFIEPTDPPLRPPCSRALYSGPEPVSAAADDFRYRVLNPLPDQRPLGTRLQPRPPQPATQSTTRTSSRKTRQRNKATN